MPADRTLTSVVVNGINGRTGRYDVEPLDVAALARGLADSAGRQASQAHVVDRGARLKQRAFDRGLPFGVEPHDVPRAGWGIVFHADEDPKVREALRPLIEHRRRQVGSEARCKELVYHTGESASAWLGRHGRSWGTIAPESIPYYLLLVGSPEKLPFQVTQELDSDYAVGLLHFQNVDDYRRYAESVIEYERPEFTPSTAKEMLYFAPRHAFDEATQLSAHSLIGPLADGLGSDPAVAAQLGFRQRTLIGPAATRQALIDELERTTARPAVLFTASHGMVWPNGDANQLGDQGALLCQDFPGFGAIQRAHYLAAADVADTAKLHGLIAFHFACFGGGTPRENLYHFEGEGELPVIAPNNFIAALPQRLLAHPGGGALACIAHIERAWGSSILGLVSSPQIRAFQLCLAQLLLGKPVGLAVQEFNDLAAKLSQVLSGMLGRIVRKLPVGDVELVTTWTARNDASGFVTLGDPAVRLRVNDLV